MNKILIILILLIVLINLIYANTDSTNTDSKQNLKNYSIQFEIDSEFEVKSYLASFISLKYHFNKTSALRIGFGLEYSETEGELGDYINYDHYRYPQDNKRYKIDIYLQYMHYNEIKSNLYYFLGIGPFGGLSFSKHSLYRYGLYEEPQFTNINDTNDKWKLGISVLIGGEYFIISNISLLIETSMEAYYRKSKIEEKFIEWNMINRYETDSWIANPEVRFGISIYL